MIRQQVQQKLTNVILALKDTLLHVSIRLGKTKIALDAIEAGDKVLWIYPSNSIVSGYQEDLLKFPPKSLDITFTNISSIKKFAHSHYDFVIVDEVQACASAAQIRHLKTITFNKRVGLSGTMNHKTLTMLQEELNWTVGAHYSLEDGIRDDIVKDYKVFIHFAHLCDKVKHIDIKKFGKMIKATEREAYDSYTLTMDYFKEQKDNAVHPTQRLKAHLGFMKYMGLRTNLLYNSSCLLDSAKRLVQGLHQAKVLIYALRTEVADTLSDKSYHSKNKDESVLEWFRTSETGHLGVVDCVTTGITIKNLNTVIFHSYDSNTENFHQKLGRSLLHEQENECSMVHVMVLIDTQNEKWIDSAISSLDDKKVFYVENGIAKTKLESIKSRYPGKTLFLVKASDKIIVHAGQNNMGFDEFFYPGAATKLYSYNINNLKQIA